MEDITHAMKQKNISKTKVFIADYLDRLTACLQSFDWSPVDHLAQKVQLIRKAGRQIFLCGNGGSAANAMHIANDLLYLKGRGLKVTALSANQSVLTCLANDLGYENIFSYQLKNLAQKGDLLIVLSGSGNSPNVVNALNAAKKIGMPTCAILGYDGGRCRELADIVIHFPVRDMQIAEDLQLVVGHMLMQWLNQGSCHE